MIPKFRAWNIESKIMLEHDFIVKTLVQDGKIIRDFSDVINGSDVFILMQSTGLKDKNGKEIFEGDIVKALSEGYCGTFQVVWRNEGTPMYILYPAWQNEQFWDLKGVNGVDDGIEVIGNIHEHPELLENI